MTDKQPDKEPLAREPGPGKPAKWDRHQMEIDDAGEPRGSDAETAVPGWNKGEMAEERQDHTRSPLATPEELHEQDDGLSGHGSNPGGGERWAERDRKK